MQKNLYIFIIKNYSMWGLRWGGDTEPVGDGDEIQFFIPVRYE